MIENGGGASAVALAGALAEQCGNAHYECSGQRCQGSGVRNRINISCWKLFSSNASVNTFHS